MKVVFLDFNGVLDTYLEMDKIDKENLMILKEIVQMMKAKIVISSSIKNTYYFTGHHNEVMKNLLLMLEQEGMEVYGFTPICDSREEEIISYLSHHKEIDGYYILDDDYDFDSLMDHVIKLPSQRNGGNGLKEIKKDVMKMLKKVERWNGKNRRIKEEN